MRKAITTYLKEIFMNNLSKESFQEYFYEELIELLNDEDLQIRLEAIEVAVEIMPTRINSD